VLHIFWQETLAKETQGLAFFPGVVHYVDTAERNGRMEIFGKVILFLLIARRAAADSGEANDGAVAEAINFFAFRSTMKIECRIIFTHERERQAVRRAVGAYHTYSDVGRFIEYFKGPVGVFTPVDFPHLSHSGDCFYSEAVEGTDVKAV
jgi:hypothetical protein